MWVPLVENNEYDSPGADYFVKDRLDKILSIDPKIDTLILACTHYPLLLKKIKQYVPEGVNVMAQGEYVASALADYLHRHPEMEQRCKKGGSSQNPTTESCEKFRESAALFMQEDIDVEQIVL